MIYSYELDKDCEYIPVHLNVIFNSKVLDYHKDIVNSEVAENIFEKILYKNRKCIIMDFERVNSFDSRIFEKYSELIQDGYSLIFINLNSMFISMLEDDDLNRFLQKKEGYEKCLFSNNFDFFSNENYLIYCSSENVNMKTNTLISQYIYNNRDLKAQQLESTRVMANMYIDVKSIFLIPEIYVYVVYKICCLIKKRHDIFDIDYLISSSNNGAILSSLVGQLLHKKFINLVNLGPHLSLSNKDIINDLEEDKRYLLIYDFVCLGTELKLAKTIINLKNANLIGAVGVAGYIDPNLNISIDSIFNVNDEKIYNFKYNVEIRSKLC